MLKAALPQASEEKQRLAADPDTSYMVLDVLADDVAAAVRLAAAQNFSTPVHVLGTLADTDSDAAVRKAAFDNLKYARTLDFDAKLRPAREIVSDFLSRYPLKRLDASQGQPLILPFDLGIRAKLTGVRSSWKAASTVRMTSPGPHTLAEAVASLMTQLNLPAPPAFCTEDGETFYCSASTSLAKGADLSSGFAMKKGEATIYSWGTSAQ